MNKIFRLTILAIMFLSIISSGLCTDYPSNSTYNDTNSSLVSNVTLTNQAPQWIEEPYNLTLEHGSTLTYQIKAFDSDGDRLHYSLITYAYLIGDASIDSNGLLTIISPANLDYTGSFLAEIGVDDGNSAISKTINVTVTPSTPSIITLISPDRNSSTTNKNVLLSIMTNKDATCSYFFYVCEGSPSSNCDSQYAENTSFSTTGGTQHQSTLNLLDYQQMDGIKHYYKLYFRCVTADGISNSLGDKENQMMFDASLTNQPPQWVEEPVDLTLEQGSTRTYQISASDLDEDHVSYSLVAYKPEGSGTITLLDENYTKPGYERLISGGIDDVLRNSETKTYTVDGYDYEITAILVNSTVARLSVNGVLLKDLKVNENSVINSNLELKVISILTNQREGIVEFFLRSYTNDYIDIRGTRQGENFINLNYIKYKPTADEDIYIPSDSSLKNSTAPLQYNLLSEKWDIFYAGLMNTGESIARFIPVSADSYDVEFNNIENQAYRLPFMTNSNDSDLGFKYGTVSNDLVFSYPSFITKGDYFVIANLPGFYPTTPLVNVLRYVEINLINKTILFNDLAEGDIVVPFIGTPGNTSVNFIYSGVTHVVQIMNSSSNYALSIDLNSYPVLAYTTNLASSGNCRIGLMRYDNYLWPEYADIGTGSRTTSVPPPVTMRVNVSKSLYDNPSEWESDYIDLTTNPLPNNKIEARISSPACIKNVSDPGHCLIMNKYGIIIDEFTPVDNSSNPEITIHCPLSQRGAEAFVIAQTAPNIGESSEFKTGSEIVTINKPIGSVKQTFTETDLKALKSGEITTYNGSTPVRQYLKFDNTTAQVIYGLNPQGVLGDYLKFDSGSTLFEYHLEFTEGMNSRVDNNHLIDLEGKKLFILGKYYEVADAELLGTDNEMILLVLDNRELLDSSFISIDAETGLMSINPPPDFTGSFLAEVSANDGTQKITKIINITITPKSTPTLNNGGSGRHGGGGGGGGASNTDASWNCSEWTDCKDGKQTQSCTSGIAKRTNTQNCTETLNEKETSAAPVPTNVSTSDSSSATIEEKTTSSSDIPTESNLQKDDIVQNDSMAVTTGQVVNTSAAEKPIPLITVIIIVFVILSSAAIVLIKIIKKKSKK